ncbi:MAG TPA: type I secretion system permease/ATPase [Rhodocyclaceae bacterium]|nr:type I secretion system permease/ATPase [Rhodocyclaceae bacterium]HNN46467.1 type I secretion system permease/ATPase [Azospira sp.]HNA02593.1 type I secretion system permease/ATPase [Rhodocyclaceae bacterium]HNB77140.1 type I secretion system permease/ATPase [Rhodocyclaceae bacterium]HNC60187.1 type I secretion system permease/ATPase [Rhodocyclaceae bacterium]
MSRNVAGQSAVLREDLLHHDPLLDCLVEVARLNGRPTTRAALSAGLPLERGVLTPSLLPRAAARAGLSCKLLRRPLDKIDPTLLPAILLVDANNACVLVGWDDAGSIARVLFPETGQGEATISRDELLARYLGIAAFARPVFRFDSRTPTVGDTQPAHWFWGALEQQWPVYRDVLGAALLINLFALAVPLFTMNVYDRVVPNRALETLWVLAIGVGVVLIADVVLRMLRGYFVDLASARVDLQLSALIMERVLGMRMEERPASVGSFAANLRSFESVRDFITSATVTALIDLPFAVIFLLVTAWIAWPLILPPLAGILIVAAYAFVIQHRMHELSETTYRAAAQRNATLVESLTGLETIKAHGAEAQMQSRWETSAAFLSRVSNQTRILSASAVNGASTVQQLVSVAVVLLGVYLIAENQLSMGGLIACSMLASRALAPLGQLVGLLMQYQTARTSLESLDKTMNNPVERPPGANFIQRRELRGDIEFKDVSFSYPNRQDSALRNVSFRIAAGEKVALIGRVGSGKTTVEKLILGLYRPTSGAVLLDGIDVRQLDPADMRRNVGYVGQDATLFFGTLRDNIVLGQPQFDDAAVVAAAEIAGLGEFVNAHPQGFDMLIGERGESLSGGQRQSVAVARAVLGNAPILLLDEPTSAMDFSTEERIKDNLKRYAAGKSVVLVTHRTSLLDMVDRIIVVDGGRILADGPRDKVIEALQSGKIARAS